MVVLVLTTLLPPQTITKPTTDIANTTINKMITVNSLSGGKTSSYMAKHYPADFNVFALVRIAADYCKPKDESLVKKRF
jgi:hypothetical protein